MTLAKNNSMKREEMILQLNTKHEAFVHDIELLSDNLLLQHKDQKWSAAQQLNHIIRSVQPLVQVLVLPSFLLKLFFGKANRPSLSYEQLLLKYKSKLKQGGKSSGRFVPNEEIKFNKEKEIDKLSKLITKLCRQNNKGV